MNVLHLLRNEEIYVDSYTAKISLREFLQDKTDGEVAIAAYSEPIDAEALSASQIPPNRGIVLGIKHLGIVETFYGGMDFHNQVESIVRSNKAGFSTGVSKDGKVSVGIKVNAYGDYYITTVETNDIASANLLGKPTDNDSRQTAFGKIAKLLKDVDELKLNSKGYLSVSNLSSKDQTITLSNVVGGGIDASVNVDGKTIVKDKATGKLSAVIEKPKAIEGVDAINVADNTVSMKINDTDKVLTQNVDGVLANIKLEKVTTSLPENVKERYKLVGKNNTALGDAIDIYKDSSLKSVELVDSKPTGGGTTTGQFLKFVYNTANGKEDTVYVDVSKFLTESEFKNGFDVATSGEVSIKINDNSKKILTVDANGLAIDSAELTKEVKSSASTVADEKVNALNVVAIEKVDATKGYVKTTLSQSKGLVSNDKVDVTYGDFNKNQNGIATTEDTKAYIDVKIAASAIGAEVDGTYLKSTSEGNVVKISANTKPLTVSKAGSVSTLSGEADSLIDSSEMATKVSSFVNSRISESVSGLTNTVSGESIDKKVSVSVTQTEGKLASVSVTTKGLEVDTSKFVTNGVLATEIANRKRVTGVNGDSYTAPSTATYIKNATSMNDADVKLDGAIKTVANEQLSNIKGSDAVSVSAKSGKVQTVSIKLDNETSDNALKINDGKGLYLSSVIDCGTFDI